MTPIVDATPTYSYRSIGQEPVGIDWEERRYEIAKAVLPSLTQVKFDNGYPLPQRVKLAIRYADELIKQLKGGEQ